MISPTAGKTREPIGACKKCGSLTCGHHGVRNKQAEFLCIECDTALQGSSAGWNAWRLNQGDPSELAYQLRRLFPSEVDGLPPASIVRSFDEWVATRGYGLDMTENIVNRIPIIVGRIGDALDRARTAEEFNARSASGSPGLTHDLERMWGSMDDDGRTLLAAAIATSGSFLMPSSVPEPLEVIATFIDYPPRRGLSE
ncbi:hypothetical protein ACFVKB_22995 [Rhodococcus sp. NPDC127530]|uniref:hypothetical protein n=1 Tax=unclassified Rhodococcus (in: high G+C Gram-positive bacteria) TaxID=192944 RepID=UPI0036352C7F